MIVSLVVFIVPIWIAVARPDQSAPPSQIDGDCNAQGSDNNVTCQIAPTPEARGQVDVTVQGGNYALYSGLPSMLPTPPEYPVERVTHHCDEWSDWFGDTPSTYRVNPTMYVGLQTGEADLVVLTRVESKIFRRIPLSGGTLIQCLHGGQGVAGYSVTVNTLTGKTTYTGSDDDIVRDMPPGAIEARKLDYQGVMIYIESQENSLYEGSIVVSYTINGKAAQNIIGTAERPLRWIADPNLKLPESHKEIFDWHPTQHRWVANFDHLNFSG